MLVLSRHRNQQIVIRDDIVITVIEIRGDKVRLGIDAPIHVPVHRREIWEALRKKEAEASTPTSQPASSNSVAEEI